MTLFVILTLLVNKGDTNLRRLLLLLSCCPPFQARFECYKDPAERNANQNYLVDSDDESDC